MAVGGRKAAENTLDEVLRQLVALRDVDARIDALEQELAAQPARRADAASRVERAGASRAEAGQRLETAELEERRLAGEVRDREALVERLQGQTAQVKSNEAYRALLHEMEQAREAISERETAILEAMETIDDARAALAAAENDLRESQTRAGAEEEAVAKREDELRAELERQRERRNQCAAAVGSDLLARYERIAARRKPAVAVVVDEVCLGCHTRIPPQQSLQLLRGGTLQTCSRCQRILVREGVVTDAGAA